MARGQTSAAAYGAAGYKTACGGGARLATRAPVAARIAELAAERALTSRAGLATTIAALLALADNIDLRSAAGAKEARLARLEANRLWAELTAYQDEEYSTLPPELTEAEWVAKYGDPAPGGGV